MSQFPGNKIGFLNWVKGYKKQYLSGDISAGLTVGILVIPQGMAYALIAGLPPVYGLYAAFVPTIVYAILGTSRQLTVGPVAMDSLLVAAGLGALNIAGVDEYVTMAFLLAFTVGIVLLFMGIFRMGFLVNFLSRPVVSGFTSAAALIIGLNQIGNLTGADIAGSSKIHHLLLAIGEGLHHINLPTIIIGIVTIIILVIFKRKWPKFPIALLTVIIGTCIVYGLKLNLSGVGIIGQIPSGFPSFSTSFISIEKMGNLALVAIPLALIAFMEAISLAKTMEDKNNLSSLNANRELIALGSANIIGSLFQSFSVTGSFSRTSVNNDAGAKSGLASIISALVVGLTLLFFTRLFYYLPNAVLAAIIIVSVASLFNVKLAKELWLNNKQEFLLLIITFSITLIFGITLGILLGIALSLILLIYRVSNPHIAELGQIPGTTEYRNIERFEDLNPIEDLLVVRFDAQLYFANINFFIDYIKTKVNHNPTLKFIVVECSAINYIDSTAIEALKTRVVELHKKDITIVFAELKGPVRDILKMSGILHDANKSLFFLTVDEAVKSCRGISTGAHSKYSHQSNK